MILLNVIGTAATLAGLVLAVMLVLLPRFGPSSWILVLFLIPGSLSTGFLEAGAWMGWPANESSLLSFMCLLFCGAGGCMASYIIGRENYLSEFKKHSVFLGIVSLAALVLVIALCLSRPSPGGESESSNLIPLGISGYLAAVYLLVISVVALTNVEHTLRNAQEHVRWEIKFLMLGLASVFGAMVYIASQVLIFGPISFLSPNDLRIIPAIFLCSCLLIFQSWRRATGRTRVAVSQGVVFSTITLLSVGLYLVAFGIIARWAGEHTDSSVPTGPIIFLMSVVTLAGIFLGTAFRHRTRGWIRRNLYAGEYDYRQSWMVATERIRSTDSLSDAASALAELSQKTLGSLNVGVWLRQPNSNMMSLIGFRGNTFESLPPEMLFPVDPIDEMSEPTLVNELDSQSKEKWPSHFLETTNTTLIAPLISSGRVIGLLMLGSDRSGRPFDREAREFIRVLAVHAASEFHKSELLATLVTAREAEAFQTFSTFLLHDLKNFASTLALIAKNAARHHANPDFQLDAFQSILETSEKMKKLCNSLGTFSTTLAANKRDHDLNEIIRRMAQIFETSLAQRLEMDLNPIPFVFADAEEMMRVLQNLILNAHEASTDGIIRISTKCETDRIVISVTDSGKGIPAEFMERELFQPFHTTKGDGLGIGLYQSKKILEAHGGNIEVKSELGKGTEVRILIPATGTSTSEVKAGMVMNPPSPAVAVSL
jgi:putative PEP-CTERM system histidine kinase